MSIFKRFFATHLKHFEVPIKSFATGEQLGYIGLSPATFGHKREDIIYRCLQYERSWAQQGTESTKALGQVRGSSNKPFPQKKRGKARVGTIRAPMFKGGYNVHGPRPHLKTIDIQRKVYDLGIKSALGLKLKQKQLIVVDELFLGESSKKALEEKLNNLGLLGSKCYFLTQSEHGGLIHITDMFTKKIKKDGVGEKPILLTKPQYVSVWNLLDYEHLLIDKSSIEYLEERYQ